MNVMEKLAREIARVAAMQERHRMGYGAPHSRITAALERAYEAAGSGEALDVVEACEQLKGLTHDRHEGQSDQ